MNLKFKIGYWYKFVGNLNDYHGSKIDNNKWNKCVGVIENFNNFAQFEGMESGWWGWYYCEDFIESKYSPKEKIIKLLEEL
jgi:hypothetical protein